MPLPNPPSPLIAWLMAEVRLDDTLGSSQTALPLHTGADISNHLLHSSLDSLRKLFSTCSIISVNFDSIPFVIASVKEVIMAFM